MKKLAALLLPLMLLIAPVQAGDKPTLAQITAETTAVTDAYFNNYVSLKWDALGPLMADDIIMSDPTGTLIFGNTSVTGKAALIEGLAKTLQGLKHMTFRPLRTIHSGHFSLYEGELEWTIDMRDGRDVTSVTPIVTILEAKDGKIVSHRDYVDYAPFLFAERANRPAKK